MGWPFAATLLAVLAFAAQAQAQARPDTRTMSCEQGRALVQSTGAIVLTTGPHTYDRFVVDGRFCPSGQIAEPAWVQTGDAARCRIGNICVLAPDPEDFWRFRR